MKKKRGKSRPASPKQKAAMSRMLQRKTAPPPTPLFKEEDEQGSDPTPVQTVRPSPAAAETPSSTTTPKRKPPIPKRKAPETVTAVGNPLSVSEFRDLFERVSSGQTTIAQEAAANLFPPRIFKEPDGDLASTIKEKWNQERDKKRQEQLAESVIRPLVNQAIENGVLPKPAGPVKISIKPDTETPLAASLRRSIELRKQQDQTQQSGCPPHAIIRARAGTGKTTTLIEGLKLIRGMTVSINPSEQQRVIWDTMELSRGARFVCMTAFNANIADELLKRVPPGCDAMTMHRMGNRAVWKAFGEQEPTAWATDNVTERVINYPIQAFRREKPLVARAVKQLVSLCKQNLTGFMTGKDTDWELELDLLSSHYDIDLGSPGDRSETYGLVPEVLEACKAPKGEIHFDDMIWLPIVLNLPVFRFDLLLVDEAQDLNRAQQALARKAGLRLMLCGDDCQAIYGFAGADSESLPRMEAELAATPQGCIVLPLTVTRRCGKKIVEQAQTFVPDIDAFSTNPEGLVRWHDMSQYREELPYRDLVKDGDMILCRLNGPLVSECFAFVKRGRRAEIIGRDIGQGLVATIENLKAHTVPELVSKLEGWLKQEMDKENAKKNPSEARLIALVDRYACLNCFIQEAKDILDVVRKIREVFTDNKGLEGIRMGSIHRVKGLEADRVFILQLGKEKPPKSAWQAQQERNLKYVAITRAKHELNYVTLPFRNREKGRRS